MEICEKWEDLLTEELFCQGDREASLGFRISPTMDRNHSNLFVTRLNFIEFVLSPLIIGILIGTNLKLCLRYLSNIHPL